MSVSEQVSGSVAVKNPNAPLAIVAVGGTSRGDESLGRFFGAMPARTGLSFVVLASSTMHQANKLLQTLQLVAGPSVETIVNGMEIAANRVYLCPPFHDVVLKDGVLNLVQKRVEERVRNSFDRFLKSLSSFAPNCAAVLLSGHGSDGIIGCRHLRQLGGLTLIEANEQSSKSDGSDNGLFPSHVDWSLKLEDMPSVLLEHFHVDESMEDDSLGFEGEHEVLMLKLLSLVEETTHVNFKQYRVSTIKRRISQRMHKLRIDKFEAYVAYAEDNPEELEELYRDFMIGVTGFFRDEEAFRALSNTALTEIFAKRQYIDEVRIWVCGCASGEEAYSIAILIDEYARKMGEDNFRFKIFATDAHASSIHKGVRGFYPKETIEMLSAERQQNYFVAMESGYQVSSEIRSRVVFAEHNLLSDPPFTKIDLVLCRNLLIYFNRAALKKALYMILFSMRHGGFLFLGKSESPTDFLEQLETVDGKSRIFRKDGVVSLAPQLHLFQSKDGSKREVVSPVSTPDKSSQREEIVSGLMNSLLEKHFVRSILVNTRGEITHVFGDCDRFLKPISGKVTMLLESRIHPDLVFVVNSAIQRTLKTKKTVTCSQVKVTVEGKTQIVRVDVEHIQSTRSHEEHLHIILSDVDSGLGIVAKKDSTLLPFELEEGAAESENREEALERELQVTRLRLHETISQLETSNQELQMANEELLTSNEELQSTNEELHSVNEELFSVNSEYELKNRELASLNEDVNNLLSGTEIGTVFVDQNLRIRKFTPAIAGTLNLLDQDIGRPIEHISHKLTGYDDLSRDIERVIATEAAFEREAQNESKDWLLVRILPFRTEGAYASGAVLTFVDITALKKAELEVVENQRKLQLALEAADFGVWSWERKTNRIEVDQRLVRILELGENEELVKNSFLERIQFPMGKLGEEGSDSEFKAQESVHHSASLTLKSGERGYLSGRGIVYRNFDGKIERASGVVWDETHIKKKEQQVLEKKNDLETLLYVISHDLREPVRAIRSFAKLLDSNYADQLEDKARDFLGRIERGSERMTQLLDDVLELSRITKMEQPVNQVEAKEVVEAALRALENKIQETNAKIIVASDLPDLRADFTYAKQAIYNLIGNALKFVNEGESPEIEIGPYVDSENGLVGVVVRDRGPGIAEDCRDRVFKLFQRAVGRDVEGTGAGLAIIKQIAIKHGGNAWYEPRAGGGSKFTITFAR